MEEEIDYDDGVDYDIEYQDNAKEISNPKLDYELIISDKIMKNRELLIEQFMECSCLNYDEAELVLNHFNYNYDKLVAEWFDNIEEIKIDSHIEQSPESIVNITEYYQNNQLYENTCIICENTKKDKDFIYLKCEHKTCKNCMATYLIDILFSEEKNVLSTLCPLKGCNLYVTRSIFKKCIDNEMMIKIYEESIKNIFINKNKNIKKCPNKDCNYFIKYGINISKEIECRCGLVFCFSCLEEPHSPCFCEMIKHWKLMEKEIIDFSKLKSDSNCPKCKRKKLKYKITNHIKCECGEEFCFHCESKWNTHNNDCYYSESGKNKFYKFYKIVKLIDKDQSFIKKLEETINNYKQDLIKVNLELHFLDEVLYSIEDYYKFYKYLSIYRYFLFDDVDANFLDYNFSFLYSQINKILDLLEFDSIPNILNISEPTDFKNKFVEFRDKILLSMKSIKIYKNNIIEEIAKNIFGKIDYKLLEEPVDFVKWSTVITSREPVNFIIEIIKSNDFSFYSLKKRFNYFIYTGLNISKDDEFIMKLYSQGYAFTMTNYLRKKEIDQSWGNYNEKEIKSSICCLQNSIFRNNNVENGQVVYRAIKIFRFPEYKPKSKFYFREFLSTSTKKDF